MDWYRPVTKKNHDVRTVWELDSGQSCTSADASAGQTLAPIFAAHGMANFGGAKQLVSGTCVFGRPILNVLGCVWLDV